MAVFYDTHAHLGFPDFAADLDQVVARAEAAGIARVITIGTDLESSRKAVVIAEKFPSVYAAVGWHPNHVASAPADVRPGLRELAAHPKVVAIGETGLDFYKRQGDPRSLAELERDRVKQAEAFEQQMELAAELGLNCIIHQRDSFDATLRQLEPFASKLRGVFHCFSESVAAMERIMELGSFVSFTGIVTFKNGQNARDALAAAPPGRFMLETDCPFLAPVPFRGKRCEPAYVKEISLVAAETRRCAPEDLSAETCDTAQKFFARLRPH